MTPSVGLGRDYHYVKPFIIYNIIILMDKFYNTIIPKDYIIELYNKNKDKILLINNVGDTICYLIAALQSLYTIIDKIKVDVIDKFDDNTTQLIVKKLKLGHKLENAERVYYNRYLIVQTLLELTDDDFINKTQLCNNIRSCDDVLEVHDVNIRRYHFVKNRFMGLLQDKIYIDQPLSSITRLFIILDNIPIIIDTLKYGLEEVSICDERINFGTNKMGSFALFGKLANVNNDECNLDELDDNLIDLLDSTYYQIENDMRLLNLKYMTTIQVAINDAVAKFLDGTIHEVSVEQTNKFHEIKQDVLHFINNNLKDYLDYFLYKNV